MDEKETELHVGAIFATWLGFSLVALSLLLAVASHGIAVNTIVEAWQVIAISAGHSFALGAVAMGLVAVAKRIRLEKERFQALAIAAVGIGIGILVLDIDMSGVAQRLAGRLPLPLVLVFVSSLFSLLLPFAFWLGRRFARGYGRLVVLVLAIAVVLIAAHSYAGLYEGIHLFSVLCGGVFVASAFYGARLPSRLKRAPRWLFPGLSAFTCIWGALSVWVLPSDLVRVAVLGIPAAVLAPYQVRRSDEGGEGWTPSEAERPWFESREHLPPIPPSPERLLPADPIVIVLTVDSFRFDVLEDASRRKMLPGIFHLRDESVYFSQARTAGASTIPSLSSMFASAYYSQFYWTRGEGWNQIFLLEEDKKERFPELLTRAGVRTAKSDSIGWLNNQYRITCGFQEEKTIQAPAGAYSKARDVLAVLIEALQKHSGGPLFLYAHLLDAHSPFNSAKKDGPIFERYVAELGIVDSEIRRLLTHIIRAGLWPRTTFILSADHGEGFLEHGLAFHGQSLYEELVHVPLLIRIPGVEPRVIDEPVSLLDMGPTILDLFGLPTPGASMGQSLVPLLAGKPASLTRPIVAEAQLKHSIVTPDRMKIIHDTRLHTVQLYDLKADPAEKNNLYDPTSADALKYLGMVKKLFEVHTLRKPGYQVPFRRW